MSTHKYIINYIRDIAAQLLHPRRIQDGTDAPQCRHNNQLDSAACAYLRLSICPSQLIRRRISRTCCRHCRTAAMQQFDTLGLLTCSASFSLGSVTCVKTVASLLQHATPAQGNEKQTRDSRNINGRVERLLPEG